MARSLRIVFFLSCISLISWIGYGFYQYYFDTSIPSISTQGIEENKYYANDIHCIIEGKDDYKVKYLSIRVDDTIILNKHHINNSKFEYHITIPTASLENGPHTLGITAVDSSKKANTSTINVPFIVDNTPLQCTLLKKESSIKVFQGNTLHLQFQSSKDVAKALAKTLSYEIECCKESSRSHIYECFIPIPTDEIPNEYLITLDIEDHVGNRRKLETVFQVVQFPFKTQTVAVDSHHEAPQDPTLRSPEEFKAEVQRLSMQSPNNKLWSGSFFVPCTSQRISTEFGVMRISREYGRYTHNGVDFVGLPKSPVWACQDGILVLKDHFVHTGKTVIIDHGCGILSIYGHLDDYTHLEVGCEIKKGNIIGKIGKSGYATGYHLHFEMRIQNIPINPMEWLN